MVGPLSYGGRSGNYIFALKIIKSLYYDSGGLVVNKFTLYCIDNSVKMFERK